MYNPNVINIQNELMKKRSQRQESNQMILNKLAEYLRANPDQRFHQALINLNLIKQVEEFYVESIDALNNMR